MSTWGAPFAYTSGTAMSTADFRAISGSAVYLGDASSGRPGAIARNWTVTATTSWQTVNGGSSDDIVWNCKGTFTTGATHRFTVPTGEAGWFVLGIEAYLDDPGSTEWLRAGIAKNGGSTWWLRAGHHTSTAGAQSYRMLAVNAMTVVRLAAAQYVVAKVAAGQSATVSVNWFMAQITRQ